MGASASQEQPITQGNVNHEAMRPLITAIGEGIITNNSNFETLSNFTSILAEHVKKNESVPNWESVFAPILPVPQPSSDSLVTTLAYIVLQNTDKSSLDKIQCLVDKQEKGNLTKIITSICDRYATRCILLSSLRGGLIFEYSPMALLETTSVIVDREEAANEANSTIVFGHCANENRFFAVTTSPPTFEFYHPYQLLQSMIHMDQEFQKAKTILEQIRSSLLALSPTIPPAKQRPYLFHFIGTSGKTKLLNHLLGVNLLPKKLNYTLEIRYGMVPTIIGTDNANKEIVVAFPAEICTIDRIAAKLIEINETKSFSHVTLFLSSPILHQGAVFVRHSLTQKASEFAQKLSGAHAIFWLLDENTGATKFHKMRQLIVEQKAYWQKNRHETLKNFPVKFEKETPACFIWRSEDKIPREVVAEFFGSHCAPDTPYFYLNDNSDGFNDAILANVLTFSFSVFYAHLQRDQEELSSSAVELTNHYYNYHINWQHLGQRLNTITDSFYKTTTYYRTFCEANIATQLFSQPETKNSLITQITSTIVGLKPTSREQLEEYMQSITKNYLFQFICSTNTVDYLLRQGIDYFYGIIHEILEINNIVVGRDPKFAEFIPTSYGILYEVLTLPSSLLYSMCSLLSFRSEYGKYMKGPEAYLNRKLPKIIDNILREVLVPEFTNIFQVFDAFITTTKNLIYYRKGPELIGATSLEEIEQIRKLKAALVQFDLLCLNNGTNMDTSALVVHTSSEKLGSGNFGAVLSGTYQHQPVAVKSISRQGYIDNADLDTFWDAIVNFNNERMILQRLHHNNIVTLKGWCAKEVHVNNNGEVIFPQGSSAYNTHVSTNGQVFYLVFDRYRTLHQHWKVYRPTNSVERIEEFYKFVSQAIGAFQCIHKNFILHRDIKSANLLVDQNGDLLVTDVGASKPITEYKQTGAGTPTYQAPEVASKAYGYKADVYSFGILLWEFWYRKEFPHPRLHPQIRHNVFHKEQLDEKEQAVFEIVKGIFLDCTEDEPAARPNFSAISHMFAWAEEDTNETTSGSCLP